MFRGGTYLLFGSVIAGVTLADLDARCPNDPKPTTIQIASKVLIWPMPIAQNIYTMFQETEGVSVKRTLFECKVKDKRL